MPQRDNIIDLGVTAPLITGALFAEKILDNIENVSEVAQDLLPIVAVIFAVLRMFVFLKDRKNTKPPDK